MNLKDYDDAELFDEDQAEEEYAEEYEGMGGGKYYKLKDGTYKYGVKA